MITTLTFMIAALGVLLICILFAKLYTLDQELKLKRHRSNDAGLADILNYASVVDDGVIVCKNGAFMAAWTYKGSDTASSTEREQETASYHLNKALAVLGSGWMIHADAVRKPAPKYSPPEMSHFPDPVSAAIDEERRRFFEGMDTMYEGQFILTVTWFPPVLAERKFTELMFDDDLTELDGPSMTADLIERFKRECRNIEGRLSSIFTLERLGGEKLIDEDGSTITHDTFLSWLQFCITGKHHPIRLPNNPSYLDALIGGQELWGGVVPKVGRNFIQVVAIEGFPFESTPGMLNLLAELSCRYRWSSRFIFLDPHEAVSHLDRYRKKWRQKVRGFLDQIFNTNNGVVDQDALSMVKDAEAAIAEVNSGISAMGYYTSVVILMDEDRTKVETTAREVEKTINRLGFTARVETINTLDAYMGSLPGHGYENVRRPLINTINLADLLPTSSIWTGAEYAPSPLYPPESPPLMHCVTQGATPFRLNLFSRGRAHTVLAGFTGGGKSTHLGLFAAQLRRYPGMCIYVFDKGMSMYALTKAMGGKHFSVAGDGDSLAFCPLHFLKSRTDRGWALEWIETIVRLNGVDTTAAHRNSIGEALISMNNSGAQTLSEFHTTIQDREIREALEQYTVNGAMGHLLDAEEDGLALSNFITFEIEELMSLGEKFALPVLLYLFQRIERSLIGQPAAIILDEAWLMLGHPVFREKIREWLKVLRKKNCFVLMATQSLTDISNSGICDVIIESTATKIFLPNVYAKNEDAAALYQRMGLNSRQIEILTTAVPKKHYYYVSEEGRRLYELALGPLALAFVGASDKESITAIKTLEKRHGDEWVHHWLAMKGLRLSDYISDYHPQAQAA
jgi:type IV secretion system protein TrbE